MVGGVFGDAPDPSVNADLVGLTIRTHCIECHNFKRTEGDLNLVNWSKLDCATWKRIEDAVTRTEKRMPLGRQPLQSQEVAAIKAYAAEVCRSETPQTPTTPVSPSPTPAPNPVDDSDDKIAALKDEIKRLCGEKEEQSKQMLAMIQQLQLQIADLSKPKEPVEPDPENPGRIGRSVLLSFQRPVRSIAMPINLDEHLQLESVQSHQHIINESKGNIQSSNNIVRHVAAKKFDEVNAIESKAVKTVLEAASA